MPKPRKADVIKMLEGVLGKLTRANYNVQGNALGGAIREVSYTVNKIRSGEIKLRD